MLQTATPQKPRIATTFDKPAAWAARSATAAVCTLSLALAAPAQAFVIDDFVEPSTTNWVYYQSTHPTAAVFNSTAAAAVPGGYRNTALGANLAAPGDTYALLNGGGDLWAFSTGAQRMNFSFSYGLVAAMNLDLSGSSALRLSIALSTPAKLVVYAFTHTSPGANPDGSGVALDLPALSMQNFDIALSSFTLNSSTGQPVNWADVDMLAFALSASGPATVGGDAFWIQSVSALPVPEPTSAWLLAGGLALLGCWRRGRG